MGRTCFRCSSATAILVSSHVAVSLLSPPAPFHLVLTRSRPQLRSLLPWFNTVPLLKPIGNVFQILSIRNPFHKLEKRFVLRRWPRHGVNPVTSNPARNRMESPSREAKSDEDAVSSSSDEICLEKGFMRCRQGFGIQMTAAALLHLALPTVTGR